MNFNYSQRSERPFERTLNPTEIDRVIPELFIMILFFKEPGVQQLK